MLFADTVLPKFPKDTVHKVAPSDLQGMGEGSSLVGIKENLTYTVQDLWLGVFLRSGNDAVHVLAAMNGGVPTTVADMNAEAHELQADDTHVVSPDGYDVPGQASSAYDLTLFARQGLQNADFRAYCSTVTAQFPGDWKKDKKGKPTKARDSFAIQNTDRLLSGDYDIKPYPGIAGIKNGDTTNAGATYTGVAQRGGRKLLVTVMNPDPRSGHNLVYREAASLLDWGFKAAPTVQPVGTLVPPLSQAAHGAAGHAPGGRTPGAGRRPPTSSSSSRGVWTAARDRGRHRAGARRGGHRRAPPPPASVRRSAGPAPSGGEAVAVAAERRRSASPRPAPVLRRVRRQASARPPPSVPLSGGRNGADRQHSRPGRAWRRGPRGAVQQQLGHEVEPQQQGDGGAEGAVDVAARHALQIAAEQHLEQFEADRADQGGD